MLLLNKSLVSSLFFSVSVGATQVLHTSVAIKIDGQEESAWKQATWQPMTYLMADTLPEKHDFSGQYRLLWDRDYLYLQANIIDDVLFDKTANPTEKYWEDDCLEVFIDSDASGGNHQYNHSAFAYHIGLDNQAVDLAENKQGKLFNEHVKSSWQRSPNQPNTLVWEVAIKLFPDNYSDATPLPPLTLKAGHKLGFMLAYCDNDGSPSREHFMGSHKIEPVDGDTNRGWIDASVFGVITLAKPSNQ